MSDREEVLARVRQARRKQIPPVDLEIPGWSGTLWGTFKAPSDFERAFESELEHQDAPTQARSALLQMVDTLLDACVDVFVPTDGVFVAGKTQDGDRTSLGPLGVALAQDLACEGAENATNDAQGVFLIFPDTLSIGAVATALAEHAQSAGRRAEDKLAGN